jgi:hypothetical protein
MLKTTAYNEAIGQYNRCYANTTPTPTLDSEASNQSSADNTPLALTSKKPVNFSTYNNSNLRNYYSANPQQLIENYENYNPSSYLQQPNFNPYQGVNARHSISSSTNTSTSSVSLTPSPPHQQQRYSLMNTNPLKTCTDQVNSYNNRICTSESQSLPLKKRRAIPVEQKDSHYWDKRRKNNESAKRSRDIKREKETRVYVRNTFLEQENLQLKTQVALYEAEIEKLRCIAYGLGSTNH